MEWIIFLGCALLLSLERFTYWWIWNHPERFRAAVARSKLLTSREPVDSMYKLFVVFKWIQVGVFVGWCMWFGNTWLPLPTAPWPVLMVGLVVLAFGQLLNFSVFRTLGKTGVFYGNRFGYTVEWRDGFPFSMFPHPQYLGTLASIWAFFAIMRWPEPDWIALPILQTLYYVAGARLENGNSSTSTIEPAESGDEAPDQAVADARREPGFRNP